MTAKLVISLDFELLWGRYDRLYSASRNGAEDIRGTVAIVDHLLGEFCSRSIKATWAVVGAIGCSSWTEFFRLAPPFPRYRDSRFAFRREWASLDPQGKGFFAPRAIDRIRESPGQDLGTHTFCHSFFGEEGVCAQDLLNDLECVRAFSESHYGAAPTSLVFPRNQCRFIDALGATCIRVWRGNEKPWYFRDHRRAASTYGLMRVLRLADSINPVARRSYPMEGSMTRASLFLRLNLPAPLWRLHLRRIEAELHAAPDGRIFHLWFHPENVAALGRVGMERLSEVLESLSAALDHGEVESASMRDLAPRH